MRSASYSRSSVSSEALTDVEARAASAREARRSQILAVAKEVIAERGYHNASINEIIKRADIARGTFYLYFSNKHKVFDSILDEAMDALRARIRRIDITSTDAAPPQVQLRDSLIRVFTYLIDDRALTQILLNSGHTPDAAAAARVDSFFGDTTNLLKHALEHGIAMKLVRPCDTELIASALLGAARGIITHVLAAESPPDVEEIVGELILFSLRGVFDA